MKTKRQSKSTNTYQAGFSWWECSNFVEMELFDKLFDLWFDCHISDFTVILMYCLI
jgi:hypothetical protein